MEGSHNNYWIVILNKLLYIHSESSLPNSDKVAPYVFIADDAFSLKSYFMKPFPRCSQLREERIFSYRLSRARRTVENAFGILANRFRVLLNPIILEPNKVQKVVQACVVLHNFLICENSLIYSDRSTFTSLESSSTPCRHLMNLQRTGGMSNKTAIDIRELFTDYFNNESRVSWQNEIV